MRGYQSSIDRASLTYYEKSLLRMKHHTGYPTIEKVSEFNKVRAILTRPAAFLRRQISDCCPCIHQRHNHI